MKGQTVALLESRLGSQLAGLITRRGGLPLQAPALAEVPDVDDEFIRRFVADLERAPPRVAIFQTGVGTRALFDAIERLGLSEAFRGLLSRMTVIARGPKPVGVLRSRGARIDHAVDEPFTTEEVLAVLKGIALKGERVMVQRYGGRNVRLGEALMQLGAQVAEIPTYRWAMPEDTSPLTRLVDALEKGEVAACVFTNAMQAHHLFEVASREGRDSALREALNCTLVASIGPICTAALKEHGVAIGLEAHPPKLGPLVEALDARLST
jgi:uroporphyrinogen-III synthase